MRTLLLDRDGVINADSLDFIRSPEEWRPLRGSLAAIARAQHAGMRVIVVSNQSGIGRELFSMRRLNAIHAKLVTELDKFGARIEAFFFCPHAPTDGCICRKPQAGLLHAIAARLELDWADVLVVGDQLSDAEAARNAGARAVLVRSGLRPLDEHAAAALGVERIYPDLAAVVNAIR